MLFPTSDDPSATAMDLNELFPHLTSLSLLLYPTSPLDIDPKCLPRGLQHLKAFVNFAPSFLSYLPQSLKTLFLEDQHFSTKDLPLHTFPVSLETLRIYDAYSPKICNAIFKSLPQTLKFIALDCGSDDTSVYQQNPLDSLEWRLLPTALPASKSISMASHSRNTKLISFQRA